MDALTIMMLLEKSYRGEHTAPDKDYGAPMHDLTDFYPDDIYSSNGVAYYGSGDRALDSVSIGIIREARNRPKLKVKIYRAVPKVITNNDQISLYLQHKKYIMKRGKLPSGVTNWSNSSEYYNFISDELEKLEMNTEEQRIKIVPGDWVTINRKYAVEHGKSVLLNRYRILTKTVLAKQLYTDGNSVHEWGYVL